MYDNISTIISLNKIIIKKNYYINYIMNTYTHRTHINISDIHSSSMAAEEGH